MFESPRDARLVRVGAARAGSWASTCRSRFAQRRTWIETELVGQEIACPLIGPQTVGLAIASVQGKHQLSPEPLAQPVLADQPLELGGDRFVTALGQIGIDAILGRREAHLLQPRAVCLGELVEREVRQGRPAPQRQCLAQRCRGFGVAIRRPGARVLLRRAA